MTSHCVTDCVRRNLGYRRLLIRADLPFALFSLPFSFFSWLSFRELFKPLNFTSVALGLGPVPVQPGNIPRLGFVRARGEEVGWYAAERVGIDLLDQVLNLTFLEGDHCRLSFFLSIKNAVKNDNKCY